MSDKIYTELVEKSMGNRGNIQELDSVTIQKADYERYCSLFSFNHSIVEHVKVNGSVSNYSKPVTIRNIWVDFDNDDSISDVLLETVRFVEGMAERYGLRPEDFPIFFSGNKGFHVGISSKFLGLDNLFDEKLPNKIKSFIVGLTSQLSIKYVDYVIYNYTRIFRLPYSLNVKSGMYKIYLPYSIAKSISIEELKDKAKACHFYPIDRVSAEENTKMIEDYMNYSVNQPQVPVDSSKTKQIATSSATSLFSIPEKGNRNNTLFKQAFRLFSVPDLKVNEVNDIMNIIYKLTVAQTGAISHREFTLLINSAYTRSKGQGLNDKINLRSMESLAYEVFDIVSKSECVPTNIPEVDEDLGGGLKLGNLYPFIGKSGSKKSMLAQEIAIRSAMKGDPVVYFNMEMSFVELFRRTVKRVLERDIYEEIRKKLITEEDIPEIKEQLERSLSMNFYAVDNADLTVEQMTNIINKIQEDTGKKVKLAVIDSMNSMKTVGGNETFTAFENTKKLKEFAKETMCATIMINHVTQSCQGHIRDVSLFVRGGAKVIDNCDAWFGFSKCIDRLGSVMDDRNPENSDIVYLNDIIYLRFYNKRESGETIDSILRLNNNLSVEHTGIDPKSYD